MNKKILSLAVLMSMGVFGYATTNTVFTTPEESAVESVQEDVYKAIELAELPAAIQEAAKVYEELFTIESVAYNETEGLTRLILVSKADESKKTVILDKEGKELEPVAAVEVALENVETMGAFASINTVFTTPEVQVVESVQEDAYKVVELAELPAAIQDAAKVYEELFTLESVAYNEAEGLTRLILVSKADESKKTVILDKEGKELELLAEIEATSVELID